MLMRVKHVLLSKNNNETSVIGSDAVGVTIHFIHQTPFICRMQT